MNFSCAIIITVLSHSKLSLREIKTREEEEEARENGTTIIMMAYIVRCSIHDIISRADRPPVLEHDGHLIPHRIVIVVLGLFVFRYDYYTIYILFFFPLFIAFCFGLENTEH